jgi:hypothetical protein
MNFINKGLNSVELNTLKDQREKIKVQINQIKYLLLNYEIKHELKSVIEDNISNNEKTISNIRAQFLSKNIELNITLGEFNNKYSDPYLQYLFQSFLSLQNTIKTNKTLINNIKTVVDVEKKVYETKLSDYETELVDVNKKLDIVRSKQFSK